MPTGENLLYMDGRRVYNFAVRALPNILHSLIQRNGLTSEEIDWIIPHQANIRIIREAAKRSGIPLERFYTNLEERANTSAASIPIALDEMVHNGKLRPGMKIVVVGFGGGLTYGGTYLIW
jgi:3-oxoacyl-[acyl-carrier-protein] synthase-3